MAMSNRMVSVHRCFFENNAARVKNVIGLMTKRDSLSDDDLQAVRVLTDLYEDLIIHGKGIGALNQEDCSSRCSSESQGK